MKKIYKDERVVLTLDAGGTNLVFSAMKFGKQLGQNLILSASVNSLAEFLDRITEGFTQLIAQVGKADAISFAFPGPADYPKGIIGDLENLPVFKGGVALGPFLKNKFKIPVYINNDGDLFTLGEAIGGLLPYVNERLKEQKSTKEYKNLIGVTLGTGFGGGLVSNLQLIQGDNSAGGEINRMSNPIINGASVEESVSIRAVKRVYAQECKIKLEDCPSPKDIYFIAKGEQEGNKEAAIKSYHNLAVAAADAIANTITMFDGLVVVGGGLSGSHSLILPVIVNELNKTWNTQEGDTVQRMEVAAYNLHNPDCLADFIKNDDIQITIPGTSEYITYQSQKKIAIGVSHLGTSEAVALGAYAFALSE